MLCEGEIIALSIWQALAGEVDVLSFGSESATKTAQFAEVARRYQQVLIWCDREPVVQAALLRYPDAVGIKSPRGLDANDLLRAGVLTKFLGDFFAVPVPAGPSPASPQERRFQELLGRAFLLADEARELRNLGKVLGREMEVKRVALV